jgi:coenzyme F420-reducing hydrogenase alpha subunit
VAVGGFHRAPTIDALQKLLPDLEWGLQAAIDTLRLVSGFDFPDLEVDYDFVCVKHPYEFPLNEGRIVSSGGLDIAMEEYEKYFQEEHVKQSNALHSVILPGKKSYLVGPLARVNLCFDHLLPAAKREAEACKVDWPCRNNSRASWPWPSS